MKQSSTHYLWPTVSILVGIYLLLVALPDSWKTWAPELFRPSLHLGLDLQGGTQLDFRISEAEMNEQIVQLQQEVETLEAQNAPILQIEEKRAQLFNIEQLKLNVVEAIRNVIERRINSLGVSEAVITPSYYGEEKHLLVECPGVVDVQECIATVGKTILLEFKEQAEEGDEEYLAKQRAKAQSAYDRIALSGETLDIVGQDIGSELGTQYANASVYEDELPPGLEDLWSNTTEDAPIIREVTLGVQMINDTPTIHRAMMISEVIEDKKVQDRIITDVNAAMEYLAETEGFTLETVEPTAITDLDPGYASIAAELQPEAVVQATKEDGTKTILARISRTEEKEEIEASHILIAYQGATRADPSVTRSKEEAALVAADALKRAQDGEDFAALAQELSDGPSGANGGSLGPFGRGVMAPAFEEAAYALQVAGDVSDVVETQFGYHIIHLDSPLTTTPATVGFSELQLGEVDDAAHAQWATALKDQTITRPEEQFAIRSLIFSFLPTGWKDTALDGKHFQRAVVTTDPVTGFPVVQIVFDDEGAELFAELTKRNIDKPVAIFVGGQLISAPTVQAEITGGTAIITGSASFDDANRLAQDLNTGAIPAPIHLVGQATVEASLGQDALQRSLYAALVGFLLVGAYMILYYRVLGAIAAVSLLSYAVIFFALLKLPLFLVTSQHVVLTLAGIAGIILSIGMAVDANVLIFERMREELAKGKMLSTAADTGFKRAWTSIRDSNVSTLITAAILFIIGTSIVRGFAVTLSMGILISMFTAIVITRFLIRLLYKSPIAENKAAFGVRQ